MVDIIEYEQRGDLRAAFERTKKHERDQAQAKQSWESMHCDVERLTWAAFTAGEPCPGCGRPYRDAVPWEFKGTMHLTESERERYDAEQTRYREAHCTCHSMRHSVSGSLTMHCGKCCPPLPLSPKIIEDIGRILGKPKEPHELMVWRLRLFCGHVVERRAHYTHRTVHAAFTGSVSCPECGLNPAVIIDGEAIGLAGEPPSAPRRKTTPSSPQVKPTKAQLAARVRELEAEVERLRRDVDS